MSTPVKEKTTPAKQKNSTPAREKASPMKEPVFPGLSLTETKLMVLANVFVKDDGKLDYDKIAAKAGVKVSSAHTLYRNAKRKVDKLFADDLAEVSSNDSAEPKKGKSRAQAPAPKKARTTKSKTVQTEPEDLNDSGIDDSEPILQAASEQTEAENDNSDPFIKAEDDEDDFDINHKYPGEQDDETADAFLEQAVKTELPDTSSTADE